MTTVPITLEAFLVPFAAHFRADGWRIDALANGARRHVALEGSFDGRFDVSWSRNPFDPRNVLGTPAKVRSVVAAGGYDIVHVHTPIAAFVTRYALRSLPERNRPAIIYTAHGFHFYEGQAALPHTFFRTMETIAAPWTDYLITVNAEDFREASALPGLDPARVRLIPGIGVDTERFSPDAVSTQDARRVRRDLGVPEGAFVLTIVAELAPVKRHALLLEALARVDDGRVVLVIVGEGRLDAQLHTRARVLGIEHRIRWAGYRRDVPAVLAATDALVLTSEREGLNRSMLESMAMGRPVIGTDTRGIADAVDATVGWIVPRDDALALAAAIKAAASDPAEAARRGSAARERAVARFALPHIISQYEELYREALASRV